jgi:hypothetical protein
MRKEMGKRRYGSIVFWGAILGLTALFAAWRLQHMLPFGWQSDEGAHLMSGFWVSKGKQLYSEVIHFVRPVLPEILGVVFRVFQPTLFVARVTVLFLGSLYLVVAGIASRRVSSVVGGIATVAVLLVDRMLFTFAGLAVTEIPTLAAASVSVLLALTYLESGKRSQLCGAGLFCTISLLVKPLFPVLPVWLGVVIWLRYWRNADEKAPFNLRGLTIDAGIAGLAVLAPLVLCAAVYDWRSFSYYVFFSAMDARDANNWSIGHNWQLIAQYLAGAPASVLLGMGSLLSIDAKDRQAVRRQVLLWLLVIGSVAFLLWHSPLFDRHAVILSLPLALLAGVSVDFVAHPRNRLQRPIRWGAGTAITLAAFVLVAMSASSLIGWDGYRAGSDQGKPEMAATHLLEQITTPGEIVASDDLTLAFVVGRYSPPELADVSSARMKTGNLTEASLISSVERRDIQTVCLWAKRFDRLGSFADWANAHFVGATEFGDRHSILHGRRYDTEAEIPDLHPTPGVVLGDSAALVGYRLNADAWHWGQQAQLVLYWKALRQMGTDYDVQVQLVDEKGTQTMETQGGPISGQYATKQWKAGEILADVHQLPVEAAVSPGSYGLLVGMVEPRSRAHVPVRIGQIEGQDRVLLTTVSVGP